MLSPTPLIFLTADAVLFPPDQLHMRLLLGVFCWDDLNAPPALAEEDVVCVQVLHGNLDCGPNWDTADHTGGPDLIYLASFCVQYDRLRKVCDLLGDCSVVILWLPLADCLLYVELEEGA